MAKNQLVTYTIHPCIHFISNNIDQTVSNYYWSLNPMSYTSRFQYLKPCVTNLQKTEDYFIFSVHMVISLSYDHNHKARCQAYRHKAYR